MTQKHNQSEQVKCIGGFWTNDISLWAELPKEIENGQIWDEMTCCFIVSHLLEYSVMLLYYGCWIWYTLSECLQSSHRDRVHTAHGILGTQRMPSALPADRPVQTPRTGSKSTAVCVGKREKYTERLAATLK